MMKSFDEKLELTLRYTFVKQSPLIKDFFNKKRKRKDISVFFKNQKQVIKKLVKKAKNEKIKVGFLVCELTKWKYQEIYNLLKKDEKFEPIVLISKLDNDVADKNELYEVYDFFKSKDMEVQFAYIIDENRYIPLSEFNLDLIFYEQPWAIEKSQHPKAIQNQTLTFYAPYFLETSISKMEYRQDLYNYLFRHYVSNKTVYNHYKKNMLNKGKSLKITGHPQLDYFYYKKDENFEKKYITYAPHHSINDARTNWATFLWNGEFMLEYAKKHPEINWAFRPHPYLKITLPKIIGEEKAKKYYDDWQKIALYSKEGDYLDFLSQTKVLITDCGSFILEYFLTKSPMIHLKSSFGVPFYKHFNDIIDVSYEAKNCDELEKYLNEVIINQNDYKKEARLNLYEKYGYNKTCASLNIIKDIKNILN